VCTCDIEKHGAHCAACHESFRGMTNFDKHQRVVSGQLTCLDPAEIGLLVRRVLGDGTRVWGGPPDAVRPPNWT